MIYILSGQLLWRQSRSPKVRRERDLPKCKRVLERMWNVLLVCFNPDGASFGTLHCHGMKGSFERWWLLVWSCTTWSSRTSVMTGSSTKDLIIKVKMLSPCTKNRSHLNSLCNFIVSCVIGTLIRLFKMTWLSTCGSILATNRCIGSFYVHSRQFWFCCKTIFIRGNFDWVVKLF